VLQKLCKFVRTRCKFVTSPNPASYLIFHGRVMSLLILVLSSHHHLVPPLARILTGSAVRTQPIWVLDPEQSINVFLISQRRWMSRSFHRSFGMAAARRSSGMLTYSHWLNESTLWLRQRVHTSAPAAGIMPSFAFPDTYTPSIPTVTHSALTFFYPQPIPVFPLILATRHRFYLLVCITDTNLEEQPVLQGYRGDNSFQICFLARNSPASSRHSTRGTPGCSLWFRRHHSK
jgi:hypothetical protein